jgi:hypothetical protein
MFLAKPASIIRVDVNPEFVNPFPNESARLREKNRWM